MTYVMSLRRKQERLEMDESGMVGSSSTRKCQEQMSAGGTKVDPTLLDNVLIPYRWSEHLYPVG